jgi:hypothetical protein
MLDDMIDIREKLKKERKKDEENKLYKIKTRKPLYENNIFTVKRDLVDKMTNNLLFKKNDFNERKRRLNDTLGK